jgi:hypothetical protein
MRLVVILRILLLQPTHCHGSERASPRHVSSIDVSLTSWLIVVPPDLRAHLPAHRFAFHLVRGAIEKACQLSKSHPSN